MQTNILTIRTSVFGKLEFLIANNWPEDLDNMVNAYSIICKDILDKTDENAKLAVFNRNFNYDFYKFLQHLKCAKLYCIEFTNIKKYKPIYNVHNTLSILYSTHKKTKKCSVSKLPKDLVRMLYGMFF